jgi:hypothetical protein
MTTVTAERPSRSLRGVGVDLGLALLLAACSDEAAGSPGAGGAAGEGSGGSTAQDSGTGVAMAYPEGPYGAEVGATIADLAFQGWIDPVAAGFDPAALVDITLGDLWDPEGAGGTELIVLNACAAWCVQCRVTYEQDLSGRAATYGDAVVLLGSLAQSTAYEPAAAEDLAAWAQEFEVTFPLVVDPGNKLGAFASVEVVPNYVVVSARDMTILGVFEGADPAVWGFVDQKLEQID